MIKKGNFVLVVSESYRLYVGSIYDMEDRRVILLNARALEATGEPFNVLENLVTEGEEVVRVSAEVSEIYLTTVKAIYSVSEKARNAILAIRSSD